MQTATVAGLVQKLDGTIKSETERFHKLYDAWKAAEVKLHEQEQLLRKEAADLAALEESVANQRQRFEDEIYARWGTKFEDGKRRVKLNVGGQMFESTVDVLTKDRFSLLACICAKTTPDSPPVFVDRDWWLFRHILAFLRENCLPDSQYLLKQLYTESAYYRLQLLRDAVERKLARCVRGKAGRSTADIQTLDNLFLDEAMVSLRAPKPTPAPQPPPTPPVVVQPTPDTIAQRIRQSGLSTDEYLSNSWKALYTVPDIDYGAALDTGGITLDALLEASRLPDPFGLSGSAPRLYDPSRSKGLPLRKTK